jgi:hypothetical protein
LGFEEAHLWSRDSTGPERGWEIMTILGHPAEQRDIHRIRDLEIYMSR